jgi:hypothetical protein
MAELICIKTSKRKSSISVMPNLSLSKVIYQISHDSFGKVRCMRKLPRIWQSIIRNKLHNDLCSV